MDGAARKAQMRNKKNNPAKVPEQTDAESLRLAIVRSAVHHGVQWTLDKLELYYHLLDTKGTDLRDTVEELQGEVDALPPS